MWDCDWDEGLRSTGGGWAWDEGAGMRFGIGMWAIGCGTGMWGWDVGCGIGMGDLGLGCGDVGWDLGKWDVHGMGLEWIRDHGTIESLRLEKGFKVIKSNHNLIMLP